MSAPERVIRLQTVLARTGLSRSTLYRKIAEGTFPATMTIAMRIGGMAMQEDEAPFGSCE